MGLIEVVLGIVKALPKIFNALYIELPTALWKGILDGLGKAFSNLGKWFGEKFKSAKDSAVKSWSDAKEKWNNIKEKCADAFSNLKDKVKGKFNEAKTNAENAWSNAKSAWQTISGKVSDGFSGLGDKLKSKFKGALDTAKEGFSKAKDVGKNLVEGIWKGINGAYDWIKGKIKKWVGNVTKFIKKLFGIKSPSTVMRDEVGRELARGVAVGIEENTSEVEKAAEEMNQKVLDAAQKRIDDYKVYNDMTLAEEAGFWDEVRLQIAEGTDARIAADKKYFDAKI
jgi:phage-related protein